MALKHIEEFRDAKLAKNLVDKIKRISTRDIRLMEVCGTHTVSIFRSGIRSLLPQTVSLLSGPGCPVCVTDQAEIDAFIELARMDDVINIEPWLEPRLFGERQGQIVAGNLNAAGIGAICAVTLFFTWNTCLIDIIFFFQIIQCFIH